ncbi:MAG: hypothetical protein JW849_03705 [Phycisphaerae bacterium]|nr:hypothetical protein [Phycisphaerae bacterium]
MALEKIHRRNLQVWPLEERASQLNIEKIALDPLADAPPVRDATAKQLDALARRIRSARRRGASVMLTYGAHLIKNGAGTLVTWLVENGWVTHAATQGAGVIHDWEFAYAGVSSESVRDNAPNGTFGAWDETGWAINLAVTAGAADGLGFGEAMGKFIVEDGLILPDPKDLAAQIAAEPAGELTAARADLLRMMKTFELPGGKCHVRHEYPRYSALAACYRAGVPFTVHPGIGYDIFTNHPMYSPAAIGRAAGTDADVFAASVDRLDGGVYLSVGSAIMSPQVFEKAFSAANNLRRQAGREFLHDHSVAVVDLQDGGDWDWTRGEPPKDHPAYYLRFCKSFHRMGGTVDYLREDNRTILAQLIARLR